MGSAAGGGNGIAVDGGGNAHITGETSSTDFPTTKATLQTTGSGTFIPRAARIGIETLMTPVQAPMANAIAEHLEHLVPATLGHESVATTGR